MKTKSPTTASAVEPRRLRHGPKRVARRLAISVGLLCLHDVACPAATEVGGLVAGTWTKDGSPYYLTNDVTVAGLSSHIGLSMKCSIR